MYKKIETEFHGRPLSIEVGRLAKQASGATLIQFGETVLLVTAVSAKDQRENVDFFPLTCDYQERTYAAGKIPGGFFKREGRPAEKEVLTSRLMDRPIRPLFADGFLCETQLIATVLSHDKVNDPDVMALTGASIALHVSDIPFLGPIAAVRMGRVDGKLIVNPTYEQLESSELELVVAGSRDGLVMVEGGAKQVSEEVMLEALFGAHEAIQPLIELQEELRKAVGKPKREVTPPEHDEAKLASLEKVARPAIVKAFEVREKHERSAALREARKGVLEKLAPETPEDERELKGMYEHGTPRAGDVLLPRGVPRDPARGGADHPGLPEGQGGQRAAPGEVDQADQGQAPGQGPARDLPRRGRRTRGVPRPARVL